MQCNEIISLIGEQKYLKELSLDKNQKLLFYYNNKSTAEGGGVFVYVVNNDVERPAKQEEVKNFISEGKTTCFSGIPHYTLNLHKTLFDFKNQLF